MELSQVWEWGGHQVRRIEYLSCILAVIARFASLLTPKQEREAKPDLLSFCGRRT